MISHPFRFPLAKQCIAIFKNPDEILKYAPHKRSWILQSMKKFASYYMYKTGNPDCEDVVKRMIERFNLNVSLDMKRALNKVDETWA